MSEIKSVVIKKYPNRRLYNTNISSYITLEELSNMVKRGEEFTVIDSKTNEDLTRLTLTQIILEHETKGYNLLPIDFLKQAIKLYDNPISDSMRSYLSLSMNYFMHNQEQMKNFTDNIFPFPTIWDDLVKQQQELLGKLYKKV